MSNPHHHHHSSHATISLINTTSFLFWCHCQLKDTEPRSGNLLFPPFSIEPPSWGPLHLCSLVVFFLWSTTSWSLHSEWAGPVPDTSVPDVIWTALASSNSQWRQWCQMMHSQPTGSGRASEYHLRWWNNACYYALEGGCVEGSMVLVGAEGLGVVPPTSDG